MSEQSLFVASSRTDLGKGASRAIRREKKVPISVYGQKQSPATLSISPVDLMKEMHKLGFYSKVFDFEVDGKIVEKGIVKDVQFHPVTDQPLHVDFFRVKPESEVVVPVRLVFINEDKSPGLKVGGSLNVVQRQIFIKCRADRMPLEVSVDLSTAECGKCVTGESIQLPEGASIVTKEKRVIVANIAAARGAKKAS